MDFCALFLLVETSVVAPFKLVNPAGAPELNRPQRKLPLPNPCALPPLDGLRTQHRTPAGVSLLSRRVCATNRLQSNSNCSALVPISVTILLFVVRMQSLNDFLHGKQCGLSWMDHGRTRLTTSKGVGLCDPTISPGPSEHLYWCIHALLLDISLNQRLITWGKRLHPIPSPIPP